jgi:hypothetical protein
LKESTNDYAAVEFLIDANVNLIYVKVFVEVYFKIVFEVFGF